MKELFINILSTAITVFVGWIYNKIRNSIKTDTDSQYIKSIKDLRKTKIIFFISLFFLVFGVIGASNFNSDFAVILSYTIAGFSFLVIWGAFETVFDNLNNRIRNQNSQSASDDSE